MWRPYYREKHCDRKIRKKFEKHLLNTFFKRLIKHKLQYVARGELHCERQLFREGKSMKFYTNSSLKFPCETVLYEDMRSMLLAWVVKYLGLSSAIRSVDVAEYACVMESWQ